MTAYAYDGSGDFMRDHAHQQRARRKQVAIKVGRYISSDPIGLAGGLNTFNYPQNPANAIDPLGLLVKAVYDKDKGVVTVYDVDNPKLILSAPAFSGKPSLNWHGAPNGTYTISDFPWGLSLSEHYFSLVYHDKKLNDCIEGVPSNTDEGKDMCNVRFHSGDRSYGCVSVPYNEDGEHSSAWLAIQEMLQNTKKGQPLILDGKSYPNFGTLEIIGGGYGATPDTEEAR